MSPTFRKTDSVLDKILEQKQRDIDVAKSQLSAAQVEQQAARQKPPRGFHQAIRAADSIALIAEVKKASPSKGIIRADFEPLSIARTYAEHGATCLSVLTDEQFFQGHLDFLKAIAQEVDIPVLRKEFVLDPYQVYEARAAGADAVLLIAECLEDEQLAQLRELIESLGMAALVEFYEPQNGQRVLDAGATLVGVNNRDLRTFETDLEHTLRMKTQLPDSITLVGESGIQTFEHAQRLQQHGVKAMLVGESLMRQEDVGQAVQHLLRGATS